MGSILWGILLFLMGASGQFVLRGTDSSGALMAVGAGLTILGIIQTASGKGGGNKKQEEEAVRVIDEKVRGGETLTVPANVMILQNDKNKVALEHLGLKLNGIALNTLENGTGVAGQTGYCHNIIHGPTVDNFEFEVRPGEEILLEVNGRVIARTVPVPEIAMP